MYDSSVKRSGSRSCSLTGSGGRINLTTGFTTNDTLTNSVPCRPSATFYVEGWVYGDPGNTGGGNIYIYIDDYNAAGVLQPQQAKSIPATTALRGVWTKISAKITVSSSAASLYTFIYHAGQPAADKYYYDNFVAYEVTEATAAQASASTALADAQSALTGLVNKLGVADYNTFLNNVFGSTNVTSGTQIAQAKINGLGTAMKNLTNDIGAGL